MTDVAGEIEPSFECDLVMKGGVTSGIIYPSAIAMIAKEYRLRSIGGTSAGAIGAAASAAMEFGRRSGRNPVARAEMATLAEQLGADVGGGPLLFEPDASTADPYRLLMGLLQSRATRGLRGVWSLLGTAFVVACCACPRGRSRQRIAPRCCRPAHFERQRRTVGSQ